MPGSTEQESKDAVYGLSQPPSQAGSSLLAGTHCESDLLGTVSIFEGVVSILVGQAGRADSSDHHSTAVAPNGVLEQAGQFAVSVGYVRLAALAAVSA